MKVKVKNWSQHLQRRTVTSKQTNKPTNNDLGKNPKNIRSRRRKKAPTGCSIKKKIHQHPHNIKQHLPLPTQW